MFSFESLSLCSLRTVVHGTSNPSSSEFRHLGITRQAVNGDAPEPGSLPLRGCLRRLHRPGVKLAKNPPDADDCLLSARLSTCSKGSRERNWASEQNFLWNVVQLSSRTGPLQLLSGSLVPKPCGSADGRALVERRITTTRDGFCANNDRLHIT